MSRYWPNLNEEDAHMAKSLTEIRSLARSHTRTAVNVLVGIMRSKELDGRRARVGSERHSRSRLGQVDAAAGEWR